MIQKVFYQVFEVSSHSCHSVSKAFPTWLGAKRVRNRIARENSHLVGYKYIVKQVSL